MQYNQTEPQIVWITDKSQLDSVYVLSPQLPFVFAKYEVIDKTHNKSIRKFASLNRAEERKQKHLAYKKHAKCEVVIEEINLMDGIKIKLENIYGLEANRSLWNRNYWQKRNYDSDEIDPESTPILANLITIDKNINLKTMVKSIETDKNIIKKDGEPMRLTKLIIEDETGSGSLTLFDCEFADNFKEGTMLQLTNAVVNYRKYQDSIEQYPEGLKIPRWGSIEIIGDETNDG